MFELPVQDGNGDAGSIAITRNLATALPYLGLEDRERRIWIDAICVNQRDLVERSSQVKLMANIYKQADQVIVWLGPGDLQINRRAYDFLGALGTSVTVDWERPTMRPVLEEYQLLADPTKVLRLSASEAADVYHLLCSSWFERLWIRQEVHLARKATLARGSMTMDWTTFTNAVYCMYMKQRIAKLPSSVENAAFCRRLDEIVDLVNPRFVWMEPCNTIYGARYSKCSDPKDRIYAMLGLLSETDRRFWTFEPDYNIPTSCAYEEATYSFTKNSGRLSELQYCNLSTRGARVDSPTWVPDWEHLERHPRPLGRGLQADCFSRGCFQRRQRASGNVLSVKGLRVTQVGRILGAFGLVSTSTDDWMEEFRRLLALAESNDFRHAYRSEQHLRVALCHTLLAGGLQELSDPPRKDRPSMSEADLIIVSLLPRYISDWFSTFDENEKHVFDNLKTRFCSVASSCCEHRVLFLSSEGQLGLGPAGLQQEDCVSVLLGCGAPIAIRRIGQEMAAKYQVVGECYMDTLQDGAAFLGPLPEPWQMIMRTAEGYNHHAYRNTETAVTQWMDPRWQAILGEPYWEGLELDNFIGEQAQTTVIVDAVIRKRGVEYDWFDLV